MPSETVIQQIVGRFPSRWASQVADGLQRLPETAKALLRWERLRVLPVGHTDIPPDLAGKIARASRSSINGGTPSCCHRTASGDVFIVLGDEPHRTLPHELIHAGQCLASHDAMEQAFHHLVIEGEALVMTCRDAVRAGRPSDDFRDLTWCRKAVGGTLAEGKRARDTDEALLSTFGLHILLHPRDAVAEIGRQMRFVQTSAIAAIVFAYYLSRHGYRDCLSEIARELVAYRFENDLEGIEDLFQNAVAQIENAG